MANILCPNCGYHNEELMRFCIMCGTSLAKICPNCQFANPHTAHFCGMCGTSLTAERSLSLPPMQPRATTAVITPQRQADELIPPPAAANPVNGESGAALELTGERHVATILMADVRGSTELMEQIGTEDWVNVMNNIFHLLEAEIYRMGGEIDQYRGDGVLAFFGARSVHEDDPERAVLAGLLIQRSFHYFAQQMQKLYPEIDLKLRVGINTGEVIVTSIGQQHAEKTAMGGAVALAARMETSAEPGTVLVSQNTYQMTQQRFDYENLGATEVKGIGDPVTVYRPLRPKEVETRTYTQAVQWIGRKEQVKNLARSIENLPTGNGSIVMINGDKGMGKSYLIAYVWQEVKRKWMLAAQNAAEGESLDPDPIYWFGGQCRSYGQAWPYSMWFDLINNWLRSFSESPDQASRSAVFWAQAEIIWGEEKQSFAPYLAHILDLPLEDESKRMLEGLDTQSYQDHFFEAIRSWARKLSSQKPLILSFSNIQWADTSSIELLKHCLSLIDGHSIMFLITMRPVRNSPAWAFRHFLGTEYPHRLVWIDLEPLTDEEGDEFIDMLLGANSLAEEERKMIITRSEGNPYFLREMINAMIDRKTLVLDEETNIWHRIPGEEMHELPDSLHGMLQEYIANLSPEERHVLQVASVIGSRFWDNLLIRMLDMDLHTLRRHLTALQRNQLIKERYQDADLGMTYTFNSNLMRDAAYDSLLKPQRAAYHLRCAEAAEDWLSEQKHQPPNLSQVYDFLAHNYEMAGSPKNQMHYHMLAAESAEKIHANEEALYHLDHAVDLCHSLLEEAESDDERRELVETQFEVLSSRRWLRLMLADIRGSQDDAEAVLKLTEEELADDPTARIDAILMYTYPSAFSLFTAEESSRTSDMVEEALYLARTINDRQREMETLAKITFLRSNAQDGNVYEPAMQALDIARELNDTNMQFNLLLNYGYYLMGHDQNDEGMVFVNQALELSEAIDDPFSKMSVLSVLGPRFERNGDYYRWLTEFEEKRLELSRKIGSRMAEGNSLMYCGQIEAIYLGSLSKGLELLEESNRLLVNSPTRLFVLLRIAQTYYELGDHALAQDALDEAKPLTEHYVFELARVGYRLVQIMVNNEQEDLERLQTALKLAEEVDWQGRHENISQQYRMAGASHASSVHRKVAVTIGSQKAQTEETRAQRAYHLQQSLETSALAVQLYEEFGYTNAAEITGEWILYRMGQALIANGKREEALPFIKRAYDEMMRKHDLIPEGSPFRQTYLENISHHRQIQSAYRLLTF